MPCHMWCVNIPSITSAVVHLTNFNANMLKDMGQCPSAHAQCFFFYFIPILKMFSVIPECPGPEKQTAN